MLRIISKPRFYTRRSLHSITESNQRLITTNAAIRSSRPNNSSLRVLVGVTQHQTLWKAGLYYGAKRFYNGSIEL